MEFELSPDFIHGENYGRRLLTSPYKSITSSLLPAPTGNAASIRTRDSSQQPHPAVIGNELAIIPPEMPVPLITIGKVYAPIPAGRLSVLPEAMAAARQLGLAPMLAAAIGSVDDPQYFWDVASLTDPITASSIQQACTVGGRRVLFVERGAAEGLAKGRVRLEERLGKETSKKGRNDGGLGGTISGVLQAVNPGRAVGAVWRAIRRDAALREDIKRKKKKSSDGSENIGIDAASCSSASQSKTFQLKEVIPGAETADKDGGTTALHAHLAHIPVRLALALLKGMPRQFSLLAGSGSQEADGISKGATTSSSPKKDGRKRESVKSKEDSLTSSSSNTLFSAADKLDDVLVHTLRGLSIVQNSKHGSMHFTPAFLSETVLRSLWREVKTAYGAYILTARELERLLLCRRLMQAAVMVAGGPPLAASGGGGGGGSSSSSGMFRPPGGDSDEEGMEEPPEVQELMRELGAAVGVGGLGDGGDTGFEGNGGTQSPNALVRWGACFACGVILLVGPTINAAGTLLDNAVMALPGGSKLLGINFPELQIESRPLTSLLQDIKAYNSLHAASKEAAAGGGEREPHSTPQRTTSEDPAFALASQALWMAVATKMVTGNNKGIVSLDFPPHLDPQDPAAIGAVILRRYLPLLEYNGFSQLCPQLSRGRGSTIPGGTATGSTGTTGTTGTGTSLRGSSDITADDVEVARTMLSNKESAALGIHVVLRGVDAHGAPLPVLRGLALGGGGLGVAHSVTPSSSPSSSSSSSSSSGVKSEVAEEEPFGKGVLLVGDPDAQLRSRNSSWRDGGKRRGKGAVFGGVGVCVGIDDGRRLL